MTDRMGPEAVAGDTGDRGAAVRNGLFHQDSDAVMLDREDDRGPRPYDRDLDRERPVIERTINRLTRFRCIGTRYD